MFTIIPSALLWFPRDLLDDVILVDQAPRYIQGAYVGNATHGLLQRMTLDEFTQSATQLIYRSLSGFILRDAAKVSEFDKLSNAQKKKMATTHLDILVSLRSVDTMWLDFPGNVARISASTCMPSRELGKEIVEEVSRLRTNQTERE